MARLEAGFRAQVEKEEMEGLSLEQRPVVEQTRYCTLYPSTSGTMT